MRCGRAERRPSARGLLAKIGRDSRQKFKVGSGVIIHSPRKLTVGDNVYIGVMSYIGAGTIRMGNEVLIGNHVQVTASNHSQDKTGTIDLADQLIRAS